MQTTTRIPAQTISRSKRNEDWYKESIDAYISIANLNPANRDRRRQLYEYYEAYNGILNEDFYTHVTAPYGKQRKNFPAKLHRYNIVKPLIDQLVGEKAKRPLNYHVTVTNGDVYNRMIQTKQELLTEMLKRQYVDIIEQYQASQQASEQEGMGEEMAQIIERFEADYNDERAISGQRALDYMYEYNELYHQFQKGWKDFLVAGEVYSDRSVEHNESVYRILNPLDIDFDMDPDLEFVEDGEWVLVRQYMHVSSVIDIYHDEITKDELVELEEGTRNPNSDFYWDSRRYQDRDIQRDRTVEVIKVFWKSRKKVGFVTWMEDGELYEKQVEEGYQVNEELGEEVEWDWVNEVLQGHRINGNLYKRMKPLDYQRGSLDNPSKCKLPINGKLYSNRNAANISLLALLIPYQISYDIYKYRMEVSIAKSKDVIAQLDIDSIPDDWKMDKFMYYMDATGIAWTQSNKEGYTPNAAHKAVIDLTVKTIESFLQLLESIVVEMERSVGITRQRQGNTGPYEGKGVTEQSIIQSSHITEDYFRKYAWFEQRDLQALLDNSRQAWIMGKKASYFMDDAGMQILNIDGIEHASSEYAVFVTDARKEQEKIQAARQLAQPMLQNGVNPSSVLKVFESDHFATIRKGMKKAEDIQARLQEAQQEALQAAEQSKVQFELEKIEMESIEKEKDRYNQLEIERLRAQSRNEDQAVRRDIEQMKEESKRRIEEQKRRLEERRLMVERALKKEELAIKRKAEAQRNRR